MTELLTEQGGGSNLGDQVSGGPESQARQMVSLPLNTLLPGRHWPGWAGLACVQGSGAPRMSLGRNFFSFPAVQLLKIPGHTGLTIAVRGSALTRVFPFTCDPSPFMKLSLPSRSAAYSVLLAAAASVALPADGAIIFSS